jgi:lipopolysaccharide/colanic/teichoic acid biosynthesis glycosyltransferase
MTGDVELESSPAQPQRALARSGNVRAESPRLIPPLPDWVARYPGAASPSASYEPCKRALDLGLVIVSAPVWLALLGLVALAVKVGSPPGPVFYRQARTGTGGARFGMWKVRTMVVGADAYVDAHLVPHVDQGPEPKAADDPRVTAIGRLLRRTSLDELPQLWNVVRGEISLVGPRPTSFAAETYRPWHRARLDVPPGLTGLWQVLARGTTDFDLRVAYDLEYISRRSLRLDLEILVRTAIVVLTGRGAR